MRSYSPFCYICALINYAVFENVPFSMAFMRSVFSAGFNCR